jgi:hypothetical protein
VGFAAGLVVGGLIALLPPVASLLLAPLMAGYIGHMAKKESSLAYANYYGENGYEKRLALSLTEPDSQRAAILKDLAHKKLTASATESTVGLITFGLFVLVVYEGVVLIAKSQNKVHKVEREKMMQFWARVQELSGEFQNGSGTTGNRSANLEAEEMSAILGTEGENLSALIGGDEELALEIGESAKSLGIEQQVGEIIGSGGRSSDLHAATKLDRTRTWIRDFYSELSYYFAKLLELSSNEAAMIAHKMIDKHMSYTASSEANFSHVAEISKKQRVELHFLASLFSIKSLPIFKTIEVNQQMAREI